MPKLMIAARWEADDGSVSEFSQECRFSKRLGSPPNEPETVCDDLVTFLSWLDGLHGDEYVDVSTACETWLSDYLQNNTYETKYESIGRVIGAFSDVGYFGCSAEDVVLRLRQALLEWELELPRDQRGTGEGERR